MPRNVADKTEGEVIVLGGYPACPRNARAGQCRQLLPHGPWHIERDKQSHAGRASLSNRTTTGSNRSTIRATPWAFGCSPSGWISDGSSATSSRKKGS